MASLYIDEQNKDSPGAVRRGCLVIFICYFYLLFLLVVFFGVPAILSAQEKLMQVYEIHNKPDFDALTLL